MDIAALSKLLPRNAARKILIADKHVTHTRDVVSINVIFKQLHFSGVAICANSITGIADFELSDRPIRLQRLNVYLQQSNIRLN